MGEIEAGDNRLECDANIKMAYDCDERNSGLIGIMSQREGDRLGSMAFERDGGIGQDIDGRRGLSSDGGFTWLSAAYLNEHRPHSTVLIACRFTRSYQF